MAKGAWLCSLLIFMAAGHPVRAGLKVYYLRHAEVGSNVVDQWKSKPFYLWPGYYGNPDIFTPKGLEQVEGVPAKLEEYHFDLIAVSPLWRTRNTVLPYLKKRDIRAEIWPELEEFKITSAPPPLPAASADLFKGGGKIFLPENEKAWFYLREGAEQRIKLGGGKEQAAADIQAVLARNIEMIRARSRDGGSSMLLVGHGNSGLLLLRALVKNKVTLGKETIKNAALWMAEEQPDGEFRLMIWNDKSYPYRMPEGSRTVPVP